MFVLLFLYIEIYVCTSIYVCYVYLFMYVYDLHVYMCAHGHTHTYIHSNTHTHTHTHTYSYNEHKNTNTQDGRRGLNFWTKIKNKITEYEYAGRAQRIPFLDHNPPSLRQMKLFCHSVSKWLRQAFFFNVFLYIFFMPFNR
jgi:hypothetical protein